MNFVERFETFTPGRGKIALAWMGQAGFLIKNSRGKILALDVYLSDLAERLDGNKRLTPALCEPEELPVDVILASHHHADHLDLDSIPVWMRRGAHLYCCQKSGQLCRTAGLPDEQFTTLKCGETVEDSGYRVEAVFAHHGDTAPDALGFLIEADDRNIYFTGDTSYQHQQMRYAAEQKNDVLILPINGEYGNMNERDSAMLAAQTKAKLTIPCHFWTFARHRGSPYDFQLEMQKTAPDCPVYLMAQGEILQI